MKYYFNKTFHYATVDKLLFDPFLSQLKFSTDFRIEYLNFLTYNRHYHNTHINSSKVIVNLL